MINNKFEIDQSVLSKSITNKLAPSVIDSPINVRSTIFSLGSDQRIASTLPTASPDLHVVEILEDQLRNVFVRLRWRVSRKQIDFGEIIGFNIWRKRYRETKMNRLSFFDFTRIFKQRSSSHNNAIVKIKKGLIPTGILNFKLFEKEKIAETKFESFLDDEEAFNYQSETLLASSVFSNIAFVDVAKFFVKEKQKKVFITHVNFSEFLYDDRTVGIGERFEYYITPVSSNGELDIISESIIVDVIPRRGIDTPRVTIKQTDDFSLSLSVDLTSIPTAKKVSVYKKEKDALFFDLESTTTDLESNNLVLVDQSINYKRQYTYRIYVEDIYGYLSSPREITTITSMTNTDGTSRFNDLPVPAFSAINDANSDSVKILMSPNDNRILYYELDRRDLSIDERLYIVPSLLANSYGANGWTSNKFFVDRTNLLPMEFIDDTTQPDHTYQYRFRGFDLYGNPTSYSFSTLTVLHGDVVRSPVNIVVTRLREFPFRVKISWTDDNLISGESPRFIVQRRRLNQDAFESFTPTTNQFIIDEVYSSDAIPFDKDTGVSDNVDKTSKETVSVSSPRRRINVPDYLKENQIYFYRIATAIGDAKSNFSPEIKVATVPDVANPVNFRAAIDNIKIKPLVVELLWDVEKLKLRPDHFVIEKKVDSERDQFTLLGKAYLRNKFFDVGVEPGRNYIYKIKSVDTLNRESKRFVTKVST